MKMMAPVAICSVLSVLVVMRASAEVLTPHLAPDTIEGALRAAECVGVGDASPSCTPWKLLEGYPGGIFDGRRFTVLLVDGRILAQTCAAKRIGRLRASGLIHQGGVAMSVFRLEQNCGQGWTTAYLPHSGTTAGIAAGGEE